MERNEGEGWREKQRERDGPNDKQRGILSEMNWESAEPHTHAQARTHILSLSVTTHTDTQIGAATDRSVHTLLLEGGKLLWSHWNVKWLPRKLVLFGFHSHQASVQLSSPIQREREGTHGPN